MPIRELYCRVRVIGAPDRAAFLANDRIAPISVRDCQHFFTLPVTPGFGLRPLNNSALLGRNCHNAEHNRRTIGRANTPAYRNRLGWCSRRNPDKVRHNRGRIRQNSA